MPAGDIDLLFFENVAEMFNYNALNTRAGTMAFVKTLRDYFFIERDNNPGSTDLIEHVVAGSPSGAVGVWHRLGIGGNYWKTQTTWYIDPDTGHDENLGIDVATSLKTLDELVRRFVGSEKIRDNYTVVVSSTGTVIENNYGFQADLDGGTITFTGTPVYAGSVYATISSVVGNTDYATSAIPLLNIVLNGGQSSPGVDTGLLYRDSGIGNVVIGWTLAGVPDTIVYTVPSSGLGAGQDAYRSTIPCIATAGIVALGQGTLTFNTLQLGGVGNSSIYVGGDSTAIISLLYTDLVSDLVVIEGVHIRSTFSRLRSTANAIYIFDAYVYALSSGVVALGQDINIEDSHVELVACPIRDANLIIKSSKLILGSGASNPVALVNSMIESQGNSMIDMQNVIAVSSPTNPVEVTGQSVKVFYSDTQLPKANAVLIDNGIAPTQELDWSEMPYQDTMRDTLITVGTLQNIL